MGNNEDSAFIIQEIGFQPGNGIKIQVVGGLIQDDQIRFLQKKFSKRNTGLLSSGKGGDLFGKFFFRKAKSF